MEMLHELGFVVPKMASESRRCFAFVSNVRFNPLMETVLVIPNLVGIFDRRNCVAILTQFDTDRK